MSLSKQLGSCLLLVLAMGCDDEYPTVEAPIEVSGRIFYEGDVLGDYGRPAVQVAAFAFFPPQGSPHALQLIPEPDFSAGGVEYSLGNIPAFDYYLVASLVDLNSPDDFSTPSGAYPNACVLGEVTGNLHLEAGDILGDHNIRIFDNAGQDDPCFGEAANICPESGAASLSLELSSTESTTAADQLIFGLFDSFPPAGPPIRFQTIPGDELDFPVTIIDNMVPPGDYSVYLCLDRNSDNLLSCGPEDLEAVHGGGASVTFPEGKIVQVSLDIDTSVGSEPIVSEPSDFACP